MKAMECRVRKVHFLTLEKGDDLVNSIERFAGEKGIGAGSILGGVGNVSRLVAGYVNVDRDGNPKMPTTRTEVIVFDRSAGPFRAPERMPFQDVMFEGDISVSKREDGTKMRTVHIHLTAGSHGKETRIVHVMPGTKVWPYANCAVIEYEGDFERDKTWCPIKVLSAQKVES